ncbi:MAG: hypothetical protein AVDCRST_MAG95-32 [uncultured Adhaeribacter sp.]|uniref:Uncharacterized protein n=1 Tax=uncultured Adhaeribacter sp. TaxID=448109 RepID=A0A6J4GYT8_9BACT|nr:MAG: hypothetical protein AVDCRST_MAG95-32 [uncultured Adhaeribacter sp.]
MQISWVSTGATCLIGTCSKTLLPFGQPKQQQIERAKQKAKKSL